MTRAEAARRLYSPAGKHGESIDWAVCSTFDRLEAGLRDDPEKLGQMRNARKAVTGVLKAYGVAPLDAHEMLSTYREYATSPRSQEAIAERWAAEWESIRLTAGSTEAGEKALNNARSFFEALKAADPAFAHAVGTSGAGQDARVILAAAQYPKPIPQTEPPKAA